MASTRSFFILHKSFCPALYMYTKFSCAIDIFHCLLYYCIRTLIQKGVQDYMAWSFSNSRAVFLQIADRLRRDVINGIYPPDSQFPSVRQLAFDAAVNPNTMQRALPVLEEEGLLCSRGTVGRYVTSDTEALATARETVRREAVRRLLEETRALGIGSEELIEYIKKEDTHNECTRS